MRFLYEIKSGRIYDVSLRKHRFVGTGYAGRGTHRDDPQSINLFRQGPLPVGDYWIEAPRSHPVLGPYALALTPWPSNEMYGRSAFYIHGDNKSANFTASEGCIILPRIIREVIGGGFASGSVGRHLIVVSGENAFAPF